MSHRNVTQFNLSFIHFSYIPVYLFLILALFVSYERSLGLFGFTWRSTNDNLDAVIH